jgi:hypothetical protein
VEQTTKSDVLTALVFTQTVCHNQPTNTTTNNDIVVRLGRNSGKSRRNDNAEKLDGHSHTRESRHLEIVRGLGIKRY